jgi:hypothetical protein
MKWSVREQLHDDRFLQKRKVRAVRNPHYRAEYMKKYQRGLLIGMTTYMVGKAAILSHAPGGRSWQIRKQYFYLIDKRLV